MNPGDIILTDLPQADGRHKVRPALVLAMVPPFGDCLVCGMTTQLRHAVPDFDEVMEPGNPDFSSSGLIAPSLIRLEFLNSMPAKTACRRFGICLHLALASAARASCPILYGRARMTFSAFFQALWEDEPFPHSSHFGLGLFVPFI